VNALPGTTPPAILVLVATSCADAAADAVGQAHLHYAPNTYLLRVPAPVLFPDQFFYDCFEKGFAGIIVMSCGHECPYPGAFERITRRIDRVKLGLKERNIDPARLRLTAICTVCTKAYLKEIADMNARVGVTGAAASTATEKDGAA
jgi:F420-non-reducing hydrogenase iron-sulfur subunit